VEASPAQERRLLQPQRIARADGGHVWVQYARAPLDSSALRRGRSQTVAVAAPPRVPPVAASSDDAVRGAAGLREHALYAIQRALSEHDGNVAAAARQLGVSRTTVYAKLRLLRQAGIAEPEWVEREQGLAQR
jgi:transcriptional regulator of acetoin/glycerol metabolism